MQKTNVRSYSHRITILTSIRKVISTRKKQNLEKKLIFYIQKVYNYHRDENQDALKPFDSILSVLQNSLGLMK